MNTLIDSLESKVNYPDLGKLILRVSFSVMFLLHGVHKIYAGTSFIEGLFVDLGLPAFFAYGVYLGEVIAPLLVAFGVYTRVASSFVIGTCLVIIGLLHTGDLFTLNKFGAWAVEGVGTYLFAAIAILLIGPGKYAVRPDQQ